MTKDLTTPEKKLHGNSKLTMAMIEKLCGPIRAGCYVETAAAFCGISKQTLFTWFKKGQNAKENDIYRVLLDSVSQAMAQAELRDLAAIDKAANTPGADAVYKEFYEDKVVDGQIVRLKVVKKVRDEIKFDWRAAAWRLERRNPSRWGHVSSLNVHSRGSGINDPDDLTTDNKEARRDNTRKIMTDPALLEQAIALRKALEDKEREESVIDAEYRQNPQEADDGDDEEQDS